MFNQRQWEQLNAFAASFGTAPSHSQPQVQESRPFQGGNQHSISQAHQHQQPPQHNHNAAVHHQFAQQQQQQQHHLHHQHQQQQQPQQYGFSRQDEWSGFGMQASHAPSAAAYSTESHPTIKREASISGDMDWTPSTDYSNGFQPDGFGAVQNGGAMDFTDMGSFNDNGANGFGQTNGEQTGAGNRNSGGVGRLVAHFENKNPSPPPMLPPRPSNSVTSPIATNNHLHHQNHQEQPVSSFGSFNASAPGNSFNSNSFTSNSFNSNRFPGSIETNFGSFGGHQSRVTSPIATSPPPMNYGGFQDSRVTSPTTNGPTGDPFESLDFMTSNQMNHGHTMTTSSMVGSPAPTTPGAGLTAGTPGFAIWRPPGDAQHVQQHQSPAAHPQLQQKIQTQNLQPSPNPKTPFSQANSPSGYFRPPVPTTPKPPMPIGNQFILELNPGSKTKGKAPAKPPKPRAPKPAASSYSTTVKQEPSTPQMSEVPSTSNGFSMMSADSAASRAPPINRPSREQVPAEAWEGFKTTIRDLYLEQRKPLKEVMSIMADKYNFQATPKMYKTRFSQWGFVKNNTEDEVKRLLSMKFQRDAEGKVSEFVRNGKIVNLGTYLKRKGVTEYDLVDFELPADLPSHVRCRTPTPPPAPEYLKSPDLLRAQELIVGNTRKAFLQGRQMELEIERHVGWASVMVWGAPSSDALTEANFFFEAGDVEQGGKSLMNAFNQLEVDLRQLSPLGIIEVILGMVRRDPGLMTALCKFVAASSTTNYERAHPLRQIFTCLYEMQQKHGAVTLSDMLWASTPLIADELEAIYGHRHPYVARTMIDLALVYEHKNPERLEKLVLELRVLHRQMEQQAGADNGDLMSLRYAIAQMLYAANSESDASKQSANDLWKEMKKMKLVFRVRDARANTYCYHCPVKVDPWTKRCRRQYDSVVELLEKHVGVKVLPYFEEDHHLHQHEMESQDSWASAMSQSMSQPMGGSSKWGFI
ncbi:unnamed protein product [Clonostachys rosea]|uniref:Clr5 domain-containing protein n=1 Tax=Bionectria ochroleuca TaxID=29856 RepID=A0ABY6TSU1_BIOOC|nr:unnamed protein product [Clonostachys rosea]